MRCICCDTILSESERMKHLVYMEKIKHDDGNITFKPNVAGHDDMCNFCRNAARSEYNILTDKVYEHESLDTGPTEPCGDSDHY